MQTFPLNQVTTMTSSELPASCIFPIFAPGFHVVGIPQMVPIAPKKLSFQMNSPEQNFISLTAEEYFPEIHDSQKHKWLIFSHSITVENMVAV